MQSRKIPLWLEEKGIGEIEGKKEKKLNGGITYHSKVPEDALQYVVQVCPCKGL